MVNHDEAAPLLAIGNLTLWLIMMRPRSGLIIINLRLGFQLLIVPIWRGPEGKLG